jgi:hypothetical protein
MYVCMLRPIQEPSMFIGNDADNLLQNIVIRAFTY